MGQVVKLSRTYLRDPDVHGPVPIRQERYELAVAGYRSGLCHSIEIRNRLESRFGDGAAPEVFRPLKPEEGGNCECSYRRNQGQDKPPSGQKSSYR